LNYAPLNWLEFSLLGMQEYEQTFMLTRGLGVTLGQAIPGILFS
jgi:hypothetical protein